MKLDVTKLPLGEALIAFVLVAVVVTFILAFTLPSGAGIEGEAEGDDVVAEETPTDGGPTGGDIAVSMGDNFFELDGQREPDIAVPLGEQTTFDLTNDGSAVHNLHIAGADNEYGDAFCETGGDEPCSDPNLFAGGDTGNITFSFDEPGTFVFRCDFHPTQMTGTITVE
ncbi:MAG: cupredoxin domain-containing protein [Chloroflexi bacterium]|nr:cupredoxin domain-containing protein [Chloroflexota bacterium]